MCGAVRRLEAQLWLSISNFARNSSVPHSSIEFVSLELQRLWGVSKNDRDKLRAKFGWWWCRRLWGSPPAGTAVWSRRSLWASRGPRALSFWGALVRVVTKVVNPSSFLCGVLSGCYKRRQSDGFFAENQGFWTQIDDVCNMSTRKAI